LEAFSSNESKASINPLSYPPPLHLLFFPNNSALFFFRHFLAVENRAEFVATTGGMGLRHVVDRQNALGWVVVRVEDRHAATTAAIVCVQEMDERLDS